MNKEKNLALTEAVMELTQAATAYLTALNESDSLLTIFTHHHKLTHTYMRYQAIKHANLSGDHNDNSETVSILIDSNEELASCIKEKLEHIIAKLNE